MRLHLAAVMSNNMYRHGQDYERLLPHQRRDRDAVPHILESYHYFNSQKQIDGLRRSGEQVFLDSGAFSAWSQGVKIDLPQYCRFIQQNADCWTAFSVLDVIGSAEGTWENQLAMERLGVRPLPCYHYGEDPRWCEYYAANYDYMALGGFGVATRKDMGAWLDWIWNKYLTDGAGRPKTRVHGFAVTAVPLMEAFPWYSVDSSSWVQISSMGNILDPDLGVLCLSSTSPSRKVEGQHYDNMSALARMKLAERFSALGYTVEELRQHYTPRRTYCMWSYTELNRRLNARDDTYVNTQPELWDA